MQPVVKERRRRSFLAILYASIVVVLTVVLSVNWTSPLSMNVVVLGVGIALTVGVAVITYVRVGGG
jgi:hypothetical protein